MKNALLGVDEEVLRKHTAVSEEVAGAMAEAAARLRTGSTHAVSTTGECWSGEQFGGCAGDGIPGLPGPWRHFGEAVQFSSGAEQGAAFAAQSALDEVRRRLT